MHIQQKELLRKNRRLVLFSSAIIIACYTLAGRYLDAESIPFLIGYLVIVTLCSLLLSSLFIISLNKKPEDNYVDFENSFYLNSRVCAYFHNSRPGLNSFICDFKKLLDSHQALWSETLFRYHLFKKLHIPI
jgi:hypothetical protein